MATCSKDTCPRDRVLSDIFNILECNVCLENSSGANYMLQCQANGHSICKKCCVKLNKRECPVCRKITNFIPSLIVNKIVELTETPNQVVTVYLSTKYCCPFFWDCPFAGSDDRYGLTYHLADDHLYRRYLARVEENCVKATIELSLRYVWDYDFYSEFSTRDFDAHFLFCCSISDDKRAWKFWCYCLEFERAEADNYLLDITVLDYRRRELFKIDKVCVYSIFFITDDCFKYCFEESLSDLILSRAIFITVKMYKK